MRTWSDEWYIVTDECGFSSRERQLVQDGHYKHIWPDIIGVEITYEGNPLSHDVTTEYLMARINNGSYLPGHLKTSAMSPMYVLETLKKALDNTTGEIIALSTSCYISSTVANNMAMAVAELSEEDKYRDRIYYVDSRCTSHGQMLLLELLNQFEYRGTKTPLEYLQDDLIPFLAHRFTEPDLTFAIESGRYSGFVKATAKLTANRLKVRGLMPYMTLPVNDRLKPDFLKLHHYKKMVSIWADEFVRTSVDPQVIIEYAGEYMEEKAFYLSDRLTEVGATTRVELLPPPICVHTGNVVAWHNLVNFRR